MPKFKLYYTLTQVTEHAIEIEADSLEEAMGDVEDSNFDHDDSSFVESVRWEVSDVSPGMKNRTLDPALVRILLDSIQNQFVTVDFIKKDGTPRTINGQLRAASRLVGSARGKAQGDAMRARGQVWIATPDGGSKSFFVDRVTGIRCAGADIAAGTRA